MLAHKLHTYAIRLTRIFEHSELEAVFLQQIQSMVIFQRVLNPCIYALKKGLPGCVVAVRAAIHDRSPNTVSVCVQLVLDFSSPSINALQPSIIVQG